MCVVPASSRTKPVCPEKDNTITKVNSIFWFFGANHFLEYWFLLHSSQILQLTWKSWKPLHRVGWGTWLDSSWQSEKRGWRRISPNLSSGQKGHLRWIFSALSKFVTFSQTHSMGNPVIPAKTQNFAQPLTHCANLYKKESLFDKKNKSVQPTATAIKPLTQDSHSQAGLATKAHNRENRSYYIWLSDES